jgi:hypothetical protein
MTIEISRFCHKDRLIMFFFSGTYNQMIVGELDKNYRQISDMYDKLMREEREDQTLQDKLASFEKSTGSTDTSIFDYIRSVIDERNALIN